MGNWGLGALKAHPGPLSPFPEAAGIGVIGVEGSSQPQAQGQKEGTQRWRHCRGLRHNMAGEGHCSHKPRGPNLCKDLNRGGSRGDSPGHSSPGLIPAWAVPCMPLSLSHCFFHSSPQVLTFPGLAPSATSPSLLRSSTPTTRLPHPSLMEPPAPSPSPHHWCNAHSLTMTSRGRDQYLLSLSPQSPVQPLPGHFDIYTNMEN